jgi:hypothetical protein
MNIDKYPLTIGDTAMVYEFYSDGVKGKIPKLVIYRETYLQVFFNLGFGDKNEETGTIDDFVITNNGDSQKVLTTVASTLLHFTDKYPHAKVMAIGRTKSRTRLYRMGICNNLELINENFDIFGRKDNLWRPFMKNIEYDAFFVKRKK